MAKIKINWLTLLLFLFFRISLPALQGQEKQSGTKKKVEILHSDLMTFQGDLRRLLFNVSLKHNDTYMTCDSAYYYDSRELVNAWGNIHISRGDTLDIYGDYLIYDSGNETAELTGREVIMINKDTRLNTDHIFYDMVKDEASYNTGGRIENEDNVLTSISGIYYTKEELLHFKDSVKLVNPDYVMNADTLIYNTETEVAWFHGPATIQGDSLNIKCSKGWYDTKNEKAVLEKDAMVDNLIQVISADSIYYETENGYGTAHYNVTISDRERDIILKGNNSWYYKDPERFMMTDSAQFIQASDNDYMYLHADTLRSVTVGDSLNSYRLLRAWYGCRIYSQDLQAKCDSLSYSFRDSVIRMYYEPVLWSENNQLTADSISLFTKNTNMDHMELYNTAFVIEKVDSTRYNQVKGRNLTGYFRDNNIYKIEVRGNGENIYFAVDENELVGVNQATCANMDIYIDDGEISKIYMLSNPEGSLDPPLLKDAFLRRLENFRWLELLRPYNRWDIFRKE